jgi:hypothetical protein
MPKNKDIISSSIMHVFNLNFPSTPTVSKKERKRENSKFLLRFLLLVLLVEHSA